MVSVDTLEGITAFRPRPAASSLSTSSSVALKKQQKKQFVTICVHLSFKMDKDLFLPLENKKNILITTYHLLKQPLTV